MTMAMARVAPAAITVRRTGYQTHPHKPNPIQPGFVPPNAAQAVKFVPLALAGSIARTVTLANAPRKMLLAWRNNALTEIEWLIDSGDPFRLTRWIHSLGDTRRTGFSSSVGAGITDLFMNATGYVWRDNAATLGHPHRPHCDFIYGDRAGSQQGVVLAEAYGSFSATATRSEIDREARNKYLRQVKPHLGKPSAHGRVVHGYSVAFGCNPSKPGAFLSVSETRIRTGAKRRQPPRPQSAPGGPRGVATSLALSSHRSNFLLAGALSVVDWIEWARNDADAPVQSGGVVFRREFLGGRSFLRVAGSGDSFGDVHVQNLIAMNERGFSFVQEGEIPGTPSFVIEERAADRFLEVLSRAIASETRDLPLHLELPTFAPVGLHSGLDEMLREARGETPFALFADGLALRGPGQPPRRPLELRIWNPKLGLSDPKKFG